MSKIKLNLSDNSSKTSNSFNLKMYVHRIKITNTDIGEGPGTNYEFNFYSPYSEPFDSYYLGSYLQTLSNNELVLNTIGLKEGSRAGCFFVYSLEYSILYSEIRLHFWPNLSIEGSLKEVAMSIFIDTVYSLEYDGT